MTASTLDGCGTPGPAVALNPRLTRLSVTSFPTPRLSVLGCTTKKVLAVPGSAPGVTVAVARFTAHPEVNGKTNRASANLFSIVLSLPWPIDPAGAPERLPPRRTDFPPRAPFISQRPDFFQVSESTGLTGFEISFSSAPAPTVYTPCVIATQRRRRCSSPRASTCRTAWRSRILDVQSRPANAGLSLERAAGRIHRARRPATYCSSVVVLLALEPQQVRFRS